MMDDIDEVWTDLNKVARERQDLEDRERTLIESARRQDRSWREIAEALELPSEDAAQRRYRELSDRWMGIEPAEDAS